MLLSKAYNIENYNRTAAVDGYIRPKISHMYTSNSVKFKQVPNNFVTVGTNKQYSTINSAISAANSGDVVLIYPGIYSETISLTKLVHLRGVTEDVSSGEITINSGTNTTIYISVGGYVDLYIDNLKLVNTGTSKMAVGLNSSATRANVILNKCITQAGTGKSSYSIGKSAVSSTAYFTVYNCEFNTDFAHILRCSSADSFYATSHSDYAQSTYGNVTTVIGTWSSYLSGTITNLDVAQKGTPNYGPAYGNNYFNDYVEGLQ